MLQFQKGTLPANCASNMAAILIILMRSDEMKAKEGRYPRRALAVFIVLTMVFLSTLMPTLALANEEGKHDEQVAAEALHSIGLFRGYGDDMYGNPVFGLPDRANRMQGIIMLLRLLGEYGQALESGYVNPFTDVTGGYNSAIVAFAFEKGYTRGVSETRFDPTGALTATQYLTFVLRALGYEDGADFEWNAAWTLTDELGITDGTWSAENNTLLRGGLAVISLFALEQPIRGTNRTLLETLIEAGVFIGIDVPTAAIIEAVAAATEAIRPLEEQPDADDEDEDEDDSASPSPSPTPSPAPPPVGGGGGGGGGTTQPPPPTPTPTPSPTPTPTPPPVSHTVNIPDAQVGDFVEILDVHTSRWRYIEVTQAGQITMTTPGTFAWRRILDRESVTVSSAGRTINLTQFNTGELVQLVNLDTGDETKLLLVGADGQVAVPDGRYVPSLLVLANDAIGSVDGRTTNLNGAPGDLVYLSDELPSGIGAMPSWRGPFREVGADGQVAIPDGWYVLDSVVPSHYVIEAVNGRTVNLGGSEGDMVELYRLTGDYDHGRVGFVEIGADGEAALPDGKYVHWGVFMWVPAKEVIHSVDGRTTNLNGKQGTVVILQCLEEPEGQAWWLRLVDESGETGIRDGKYYLYGTFEILLAEGGRIPGMANLEVNEGDYVFLWGVSDDTWDYSDLYRVGTGFTVPVPDGQYIVELVVQWSSHIASVEGVTVNLRNLNFGFLEGEYIFMMNVFRPHERGLFRINADGEALAPEGLYAYLGVSVPESRVFTIPS